MLVLSRRARERIIFPHLHISVEVLRIAGNAVRIGIEAPEQVIVLRGELPAASGGLSPPPRKASPPAPDDDRFREVAKREHRIRNQLQSVILRIHLLNRRLAVGGEPAEQVSASVKDLMGELESLDAAFGQLFESIHPLATKATGDRTESERQPPLAGRLPASKRRPDAASASDSGSASRVHALLVEDNANESSLLAGYLEQRGIDVVTAADGAVALDLLSTRSDPPDFVLLDMLMPRCDGPATVRAIRCNPEFQGVRIYAVSGSSPFSLGVPTGPSGVDAWFQKPLDPERLVQEMVASGAVTVVGPVSSIDASAGSYI